MKKDASGKHAAEGKGESTGNAFEKMGDPFYDAGHLGEGWAMLGGSHGDKFTTNTAN